MLIAVVDGLKGFPEAITAAFPQAMVQTCIVHLVRHSLNFCAWKDRKVSRANLDENCATIWMVILCRSGLRIAALSVARKWCFGC